jgi:probable rRNA maturation factor
MLDVDAIAFAQTAGVPTEDEVLAICVATAGALGVRDGHLAVELVDERRIAALNAAHRGKAGPTDVLSFPIDELDEQAGVERELGDVVICPEHTIDLREAIVHGVLHLLGMDHETDDGQMLGLQDEILAAAGGDPEGRGASLGTADRLPESAAARTEGPVA